MAEPQQESVIIVGGGIIGIACAHYLSQAGRQVTVIDQGEIGAECSHGNCGYICPSHVPPLTEPGAFQVALKSFFNPRSPFRVKPTLRPSLLRWMWQFAKRCNHRQVLTAGKSLQTILDASRAEYGRLVNEFPLEAEWKENGLLYVFEKAAGYEEFGHLDEMLTEHFNVQATRISGKELSDFDPGLKDGLYGAFHYPGDASVRPDRLNQSWVAWLKQQGVVFQEQCQLENLFLQDGKVTRLETSRGFLEANHYVFAMGAISQKWSQALGISIPIEPGKGYSVTMKRPEHCPTHPILFPEKKVGVSPFDQGMRLGSMMEFTGYDTTIPPQRIQQLRDAARPFLVANVDGSAEETWFGWRPMTWDSLPIIGRIPTVSNGLLATGHNMIGLTLAPATGRLVAELIAGRQPHIDPTPYRPDRF